jgi:hypothetical protein
MLFPPSAFTNTRTVVRPGQAKATAVLPFFRALCPTFLFFPFFEKNLTNAPFLERFQKMDTDLSAMD